MLKPPIEHTHRAPEFAFLMLLARLLLQFIFLKMELKKPQETILGFLVLGVGGFGALRRNKHSFVPQGGWVGLNFLE